MAYELTSFDGWVFADHDWHAAPPYETARGTFGIDGRSTPRPGTTPILSPGSLTPNRLVVDFTLEPNAALDVLPAIDELLGVLDYRNGNPRILVADRNGATVQRLAKLDGAPGYPPSEAGNVVRVVFVSEEPEWVATATETETASDNASPFELAFANAGQATVHPVYRLGWLAPHASVSADVGWALRKQLTVTNNQTVPVGRFPYRIALGNTAELVSGGKAQADGDDLRVLLDGEELERHLVGWNKVFGSAVWVVLPGLDAGESVTLDVVYGNASATAPETWDSVLNMDRPALDLESEANTATGGSTTTLVRAAATWDVNRWRGAWLQMITGANAGNVAVVQGNTATTLTFTGAISGSPIANGDTYLLYTSTNQNWHYATRQTERAEVSRGRFNVNSASFTPSDTNHDAPAAWQPATVWDNRDSFGQRRWSMLTMGGSDEDPFAILDAQRMWEGNDAHVYEPGTADGLSLTTPAPITSLYWIYQFDNPNGMCQAFCGVRGSGSEDWATVLADDAATSGLTTRYLDGGTDPLISGIQTDHGDVRQVVMALGPANGTEIGLDWRSDTGSLSSGTTTTSTDPSKEWATDQFDNGSIRMLSGANQGRKRGITSGTPTQQTHAAFPAANADGDRYEVRNKRLKAILRDEGYLIVQMDTTAITASALGAEEAIYEVSGALWVGAGPGGAAAGQHRALIGHAAGGGRRVFLAADEYLELDASTGRVRIWDDAGSAYTGTEFTDPAVKIQWHDGTRWKRTANLLPIGVGSQSVWVEDALIGELELIVTYRASFLGA